MKQPIILFVLFNFFHSFHSWSNLQKIDLPGVVPLKEFNFLGDFGIGIAKDNAIYYWNLTDKSQQDQIGPTPKKLWIDISSHLIEVKDVYTNETIKSIPKRMRTPAEGKKVIDLQASCLNHAQDKLGLYYWDGRVEIWNLFEEDASIPQITLELSETKYLRPNNFIFSSDDNYLIINDWAFKFNKRIVGRSAIINVSTGSTIMDSNEFTNRNVVFSNEGQQILLNRVGSLSYHPNSFDMLERKPVSREISICDGQSIKEYVSNMSQEACSSVYGKDGSLAFYDHEDFSVYVVHGNMKDFIHYQPLEKILGINSLPKSKMIFFYMPDRLRFFKNIPASNATSEDYFDVVHWSDAKISYLCSANERLCIIDDENNLVLLDTHTGRTFFISEQTKCRNFKFSQDNRYFSMLDKEGLLSVFFLDTL